jgi:hypothetical protein
MLNKEEREPDGPGPRARLQVVIGLRGPVLSVRVFQWMGKRTVKICGLVATSGVIPSPALPQHHIDIGV